MTTERTEDYLEALDVIISEKGYAQVKDVSKLLGVGPPSVTEMFQKLGEAGYINYKKYSGVTLTLKGKKIAKKTRKKHDTLKNFLLILGVNRKIANEDACRIEHVVNTETMDRLTKFVDFAQHVEDGPMWLDHFKHFYETGEYRECPVKEQDDL
ncbi:MAG: metal-dependent transcriptional regulator [Candidatus Thermoplasmatota archaeon]|nr:metal-dependent transcriptional regulator [Candidatus Thermoplasmatota archaeon]